MEVLETEAARHPQDNRRESSEGNPEENNRETLVVEVARLQAAGDTQELATCIMKLAEMDLLDRPADAILEHQAARVLWQELGDRRQAAKCLGHIAESTAAQGLYPAALSSLQSAYDEFEDLNDNEGVGGCELSLGAFNLLMGDPHKAILFLDLAKNRLRALGPGVMEGTAFCMKLLGEAHISLGLFDEAISCYKLAIAELNAAKDTSGEADCFRRLGTIQYHSGQIPESEQSIKEAQVLYLKSSQLEMAAVSGIDPAWASKPAAGTAELLHSAQDESDFESSAAQKEQTESINI